MNASERYQKLIKEIKDFKSHQNITLVTVSKGRTLDEIMEVYRAGCRDFGENRIQEARIKIDALPKDISWHFIGPLQTNKVAKLVGNFSLTHSVDRLELAEKISNVSYNRQVITPILLQVNTSQEKSKQGLAPPEWERVYDRVLALSNISVQGLMTMAPLVDDERWIRETFSSLKTFRDHLATKEHPLPHLSMGMSHDYPIALEQGATLLRVGTQIFG